jgi:hypothetical protein
MAAIPRPLSREEAGVKDDLPTGGAERLLAALAKRGLRPENRRAAAAALCLALDGRR